MRREESQVLSCSITPHNKARGTEQKSPTQICKYFPAIFCAAGICEHRTYFGQAAQEATAPDLHFGLALGASRAQTDAYDAVVLTCQMAPDLSDQGINTKPQLIVDLTSFGL